MGWWMSIIAIIQWPWLWIRVKVVVVVRSVVVVWLINVSGNGCEGLTIEVVVSGGDH